MSIFNDQNKYSKVMSNRAKAIVDKFDEFIEEGETFLSVGDGDGYVTAEVAQRCKVQGQGLDVKVDIPFRAPNVPLDYYDGDKMPYQDNSFDTVSAVFVLHHCDDVDQVLSEMLRVAKKKVVIVEDVYRNKFERMLVCMMDYIENRLISKDINIPFNFRSAKGWEAEFSKRGLKIHKSLRFLLARWLPVRHQVFCLSKA